MPFVAGHAALDFVNTAEERDHPKASDALLTAADLRLWGQRYGLLAEPAEPGEGDQAELRRARQARELLYALLFAHVHDRPVRQGDLDRLAQLTAAAYRAARLRPGEDGSVRWHWDRADLATVRHVAVTSAVDLLQAEDSPRLKQCPGDHCGWFFLDITKRGNRRWCRMSECGQEAKDAQRRARRQAHSGSPGSGAHDPALPGGTSSRTR
jgi:predicted RNA-binding Zn ribbon-like protein